MKRKKVKLEIPKRIQSGSGESVERKQKKAKLEHGKIGNSDDGELNLEKNFGGDVATDGLELCARPLSKIQQQMAVKLEGSQFRTLNESLYTQRGNRSLTQFQQSPELFHQYHKGYEHQVTKWPCNPLHKIITLIQNMKQSKLIIADFGCGTAQLAESIGSQHKVHSFDLVAANSHVTACDIAHVPLDSACVDIGVFCLSLMGTNYPEFIKESNRVLKLNSKLIIAEVSSRFGDEYVVNQFVQSMKSEAGFEIVQKRNIQNFFMLFLFKKIRSTQNQTPKLPKLKPCLYKRR